MELNVAPSELALSDVLIVKYLMKNFIQQSCGKKSSFKVSLTLWFVAYSL